MREIKRNLQQSKLKILAWMVFVSVLIVTGGCSMPMTVKYSPLAATDTLISGQIKPRAYILRFIDSRENKESIGRMNNVFGGKTKNLVTANDLGLILAEAVTDALNKSGIQAELHSDRTSTEKIPQAELEGFNFIFGGKIKDLEVKSQVGWDTIKVTANVVIEVSVNNMESVEWVGPIEGTAEKRDFMYLSSSSLTDSLDTAMQNCMRNMIRHLKASGVMKK